MESRPYRTKRMFLLFEKGFLFYIEYHLRLFLLLLFNKTSYLLSNDLDTLLPNYLISKIKKTPLVYDSHEYFTEVPELQKSPFKKKIWKSVEKWILPKLKCVYTVNKSIASLYENEYHRDVAVIRNIPYSWQRGSLKTRNDLDLPEDKKLILMQGAGINIQRGAEETVEAMGYIDNAILLIIGGGDVLDQLKSKVKSLKLEGKILFRPIMPYEILKQYTQLADVGLTLDKDTNINYRYSLYPPHTYSTHTYTTLHIQSTHTPLTYTCYTHTHRTH